MIIERLQAAVESAAQLSPAEQEKIAEQLESAVRNALWDAQLNDPQYDHIIDELIAHAENERTLPFPTPHDMGDDESDVDCAE